MQVWPEIQSIQAVDLQKLQKIYHQLIKNIEKVKEQITRISEEIYEIQAQPNTLYQSQFKKMLANHNNSELLFNSIFHQLFNNFYMIDELNQNQKNKFSNNSNRKALKDKTNNNLQDISQFINTKKQQINDEHISNKNQQNKFKQVQRERDEINYISLISPQCSAEKQDMHHSQQDMHHSQQQNYDNDCFIADQIDKSHHQNQIQNQQQQYLDQDNGYDNSNNYYYNPISYNKHDNNISQINCSENNNNNNNLDDQYQQQIQNSISQMQPSFLLDHPQIQQIPYDLLQQNQSYQHIQHHQSQQQQQQQPQQQSQQQQQIYSYDKENIDHCKIRLKYDKSSKIHKCLVNDYQQQNIYDDYNPQQNNSQMPYQSEDEEQQQNYSIQQIDFQDYDSIIIKKTQFSQQKVEQVYISQEESSSSSFQSKSQMNYKKGPYKKYTENQKEEAIRRVTSGQDLKSVSQQMKIPKKNIKRWLIVGPKRQSGGGRKVLDPEMEKKLFKWYQTTSKTQSISKSQLRQQAKKFLTVDSKQFKASKGWLDKFIKRKNLNLPNNYQESSSFKISKKSKK